MLLLLSRPGQNWEGPLTVTGRVSETCGTGAIKLPPIWPAPKVEIAWNVDIGAYQLAYSTRMRALIPAAWMRLQESGGETADTWGRSRGDIVSGEWTKQAADFIIVNGGATFQQASPLADAEARSITLTNGWLRSDVEGTLAQGSASKASFIGWVNFPAPSTTACICALGTSNFLVDNGTWLGFSTDAGDLWGVARPSAGWHFIVALFVSGNTESDECAIYVDGYWAGLMQRRGSAPYTGPSDGFFDGSVNIGAHPTTAYGYYTYQATGYGLAEPAIVPYHVQPDQILALWEARLEAAAPNMAPSSWTWTDVTADLLAWQASVGRENELAPPDPSDITVLLKNYSRQYDPGYSLSPYYPDVRPMRPMRASATWSGVSYARWFGYITEFPVDWGAVRLPTIELSVVDSLALWARKPTVPIRMQSSSMGTRIHCLLDALGFPVELRSIDVGLPYLAEDLDTTDSPQSLVDLLNGAIRSNYIARFYIRPSDGYAVYQIDSTTGLASAVWGDGGWEAAGELPYLGVEVDYSVKQAKNVVKLTSLSGKTATVRDSSSIRVYDEVALEWDSLHLTQAGLDALAARLLFAYKAPHIRFASIRLDGRRNADVHWPAILPRTLGDRITVKRSPPADGLLDWWTLRRETDIPRIDSMIERVDFTGNAVTWEVEWKLAPFMF